MKTILISCILLILGADNHTKSIRTTLLDYIQWTTSGQTDTSSKIFSDSIDFAFQVAPEKMITGSFPDYRSKIESGAEAISRTINIKTIHVTDMIAQAILTDCSTEHHFSLIHHLNLVNDGDSWRIESIRITTAD
ncbi:MAG: nuclear transport factor 2 family protein [Cyclobacteriaceae bacterium]